MRPTPGYGRRRGHGRGDTDGDTDGDSDSDTDGDSDADGDYWVDGYCPGGPEAQNDPWPVASSDCRDITYEGCCDGDGQVIFCENGALRCIDCVAGSTVCSWNQQGGEAFYDCIANDNGPDPTGTFPQDCEPDTDLDAGPDSGPEDGGVDGGTTDGGPDAG